MLLDFAWYKTQWLVIYIVLSELVLSQVVDLQRLNGPNYARGSVEVMQSKRFHNASLGCRIELVMSYTNHVVLVF